MDLHKFRGPSVETILLVFLILSWVPPSLGCSILLISTSRFASPSHYMALSTITGGLVSNGNNVTLVTNDVKGTTGFKNGTFSQVLYFRASYSREDAERFTSNALQMAFKDPGFIEIWQSMSEVFGVVYRDCWDLWNDTRLLDRLKNDSDFDLVLVFPFSPCDVLMAHYLETPFAVVFPSIRASTFYEGYIGMPYPSSYVPFNIFGTLTDEMTFFERVGNLLFPLVYEAFQRLANRDYYDIQLGFDIHPDRTIKELYSKASLFLAHVSLGSDFPRPFTPNFVPIGGLLARPGRPLPTEFDDFVEGSGDPGVIIFTLGSIVQGLENNDIAETFAKVFSKLPQRVLWRHNADPPTNLGNNTKLVTWLPQNDLLGHPKTRLLIYHGGSNGVGEAIYHGVPMVIIPLFADQFAHAARVQKKGMGVVLYKNNITEESLMAVVRETLDNPSYKERAQLFSAIHRGEPMTPLDRAVYWIEHVIKFGDAHLRPRAADMGTIELYQVDVIVFMFGASLIGLYIDYVIIRKCCSIYCGRTQNRNKSKLE